MKLSAPELPWHKPLAFHPGQTFNISPTTLPFGAIISVLCVRLKHDGAHIFLQKLPQAMLTIVSGHEADTEAMSSIGINSALLKPVTKDDLASVVG